MTPDPELRADLIAFLAAADARGEEVTLRTPDYPDLCSGCGHPNDRPGQRYCLVCHAIYQREWKRQRTRKYRALVRQSSRNDKNQGRIERDCCAVCGAPEVEMHHPDHETPNLTVWLCRRCHGLWHTHWRESVLKMFCEWLEIARECAKVRDAA